MPELPEVETVRRSLALRAENQRIRSVEIRRPDLRFPIPVAAMKRALPGARLLRWERRAKVLIGRVDAAAGPSRELALLIHLGMSGRVLTAEGPAESVGDFQTHEHVRIGLEDVTLRYVDPRRFGSVELCPTAELGEHPRLRNVGVEPLGPDFTPEVLWQASRGKTVRVRDLLLSNRPVAGVGNIYANEACFRARVRPQRKAKSLRRVEVERLTAAVREVIAEAIEAGGSTLSEGGYVDAAGEAGWFQFAHRVYKRDGETCGAEGCEARIKRVPRLTRGAFYCPSCQR